MEVRNDVIKILLIGILTTNFVKGQVLTYGNGAVNTGFEVNCDDTQMTVYFNLTELQSRTTTTSNRPYKIEFYGQSSNPECMVDSSNTSKITSNFHGGVTSFNDSIRISSTYDNGCGINRISDNENMIYNQTIRVTFGSNPTVGVIQREEYDLYNVMCLRNRTVGISNQTDVTYRATGSDAKNNTAPYSLKLTHSTKNGVQQTVYKVGDFIRFTVELHTETVGVKAVLQDCWATSDGTNNRYDLIVDRCVSDPGTRFESRLSKETKFDIEAFRFIGVSSSSVYVECRARICPQSLTVGECQMCFQFGRKRRGIEESIPNNQFAEKASVRSSEFYVIDDRIKTRHRADSTINQPQPTKSYQKLLILKSYQGNIIIGVLLLIAFIKILKLYINIYKESHKRKIIDGKHYEQLA